MVLNGALAGLVSITAEPLTPTLGAATLIGGIGGVIVVFTVPLLDKFRIDDVVGAIPVHLIAGIWGTLAVPITNGDASFGTQITSIVIQWQQIVKNHHLKRNQNYLTSGKESQRNSDHSGSGIIENEQFGVEL